MEDDDLEEFLKPARVEDFHKEAQVAKPGAATGTMRSAADDIIDAIGGVKKPTKAPLKCKCGSTSFTIRTPLTGQKIHQCTSCGNRLYGVPRSSVWMQPEGGSHAQGTRGPYYRGSDIAPQGTETHSPTSRIKSRSYAALLEEEDK
jgi:hypothetical protein